MSQSKAHAELEGWGSRPVPIRYLALMRPRQWTKNLLVFAALIFSIQQADMHMLGQALVGFVLFCLVSSCVYVLNDYVDRERDRMHPEKKNRPLASGAIHPQAALLFGFVLLTCCLMLAFRFQVAFGLVLSAYFCMNVLYSLRLKHVVIVDLLIVASGFVLRAVGGGLVIGVPLTPWFLLCTMLLALFLAIGKRRHELALMQNGMGSHRKVLDSYSMEMLNQMSGIVTTATIMSYALFTFTSGHTIQLMWTLIFVLYGVFRYLYLIHMEGKGGRPEKLLLEDKHILLTVILYGFSVVCILLFFN
ncbi:decaprenyl-phosphate phosphoribosyltransferase [Paenibacillus validus]|uniref:Decaprenyl-phosphate phosphoribosyltransferase n=1 Tax=Paenibacillus validus TaxID=44253 RepID=A0A7X2ZA22_9BACL|nr:MULTISPECIES: decaprenyl-phosphate phosphoribosyltransferase [Paenibacillus]MED4601075.1 decaprenyl-phosphate phosphoribosyltransferase [Paenibacillus validus]MED4607454.1 decaprenyl-phosphate phosphoribosyltransferase [Paenibacillus validus]MUG70291.1 decaprenyl-phosphate phosphoribosyltransferase [Paenibacillus validus]